MISYPLKHGGSIIMFIAYIKLNEQVVPIVCEAIQKHPFLKDFIILSNVKESRDNTVPSLKVDVLCIKSANLFYYVHGRTLQK